MPPDNVAITAGSGTTVATDQLAGGEHVQLVKLVDGTADGEGRIAGDATNGLDVDVTRVQGTVTVSGTVTAQDGGGTLSVDDGGASLTVDGTVAVSGTVAVTDNAATLSVDDGGGALTVDGTVTANAGTGPWPVTDNGGSLTVDGTVTATLPAGTNNIGDVDVLTLPALPAGTNNIGDVDVASIAAGDNNIGNVDVVTLPALPAGTNNIGDVDVLTLPALPAGTNNIGDVDVLSLPATPAGTNLIGRVAASDETGTIYQGTTARTPAFAIIDAATSGDNTLLAAQGSGNKIRVHALYAVAAGTVTVRFESGAGGTALSGQMNLVANTGFVLPYSPIGWFETAANTLLNLELSGAVSVDGGFAYTVVT